jgi:hypothetical protein
MYGYQFAREAGDRAVLYGRARKNMDDLESLIRRTGRNVVWRVVMDERAHVFLNGKVAGLTDLKSGDHVAFEYTPSADPESEVVHVAHLRAHRVRGADGAGGR